MRRARPRTVLRSGTAQPQVPLSAVRTVLASPERISATFQPILDVSRRRTAGWEILTRFAQGGPAGPDQWFSAAYSADLGIELEAAVLRHAMHAFRLRSPGTFMTVNVTPSALGVPMIERLIAEHAPLHGLVIELTELLAPPGAGHHAWHEACGRLRGLGALLAIDDVGTGFAEISQILEVRPQIIKVDRQVITSLENDPARQALLRFLGDFGDQLDAWVLAEGVESPAQLRVLEELGVPLAQGWLVGAPQSTPRPCPAQMTRWPPGTAARRAPHEPRSRHVKTAVRVEDLMRPARVSSARQWAGSTLPTPGAKAAVTAEPAALAGELRPVVVLDAAGMPTMVRTPAPDTRPPGWSPVSLRVPAHLLLPEAARRAMARPDGYRFDPLICTDPTGAVLGVIIMHDLLLALAACVQN